MLLINRLLIYFVYSIEASKPLSFIIATSSAVRDSNTKANKDKVRNLKMENLYFHNDYKISHLF